MPGIDSNAPEDKNRITVRRDTPFVRNDVIKEDDGAVNLNMAPPRVSFAANSNLDENMGGLERRRHTPFHNQDGTIGRPSS